MGENWELIKILKWTGSTAQVLLRRRRYKKGWEGIGVCLWVDKEAS